MYEDISICRSVCELYSLRRSEQVQGMLSGDSATTDGRRPDFVIFTGAGVPISISTRIWPLEVAGLSRCLC